MLFLLCLQIFCCRILDVSLGTVRTILTVRGKTVLASVIGFIEVFIWFLIVRSALDSDESGIFVALAYAGGFAAGTYIGGKLADKFIQGILDIQVITSSRDDALVSAIRADGFAVTVLNVNSSDFSAERYLLVIEIKSDQLKKLEKIIYAADPSAFIMARETKFIQNGFFK